MAKNIKDRSNRQNVQRLLTILNQKFLTINLNTSYTLGILIYVGINEYNEEIVEFIEPEIKLDLFYYSCANKFETEIASKYIGNNVSGTLIFANGNECVGYQFVSGKFVKIFNINANLVKRHKCGGFSANRYARIAEESRHSYIIRITDRLKELDSKDNNWIFGSDEIISMVIKFSPIKLIVGGFLDFNSSTISNSRHWIEVLTRTEEQQYDLQYKEILDYLATNPDMLDFNPENKELVKYFINTKTIEKINYKPNQIPLITKSKYYSQLVIFEYIGVKYFEQQINED